VSAARQQAAAKLRSSGPTFKSSTNASADDAYTQRRIVMFRINFRRAAFATAILSLGIAATGAAPAFAQLGRTHNLPRAKVGRHVDYLLVRPGYAGPVPSSPPAASCDLPSSGCSNDQRITN
jgi:hypothetical protein